LKQNAYLDDIEHSRELGEEQHLMATFGQLSKQPIEHHHLPTGIDQIFIQSGLLRLGVERPVEKEWVTAHFSELRQGMLELQVVDSLHWMCQRYKRNKKSERRLGY
jgi:hypothetical protein